METIRPLPLDAKEPCAVRGQYGPGFIEAKDVKGYRQEENVSPTSNVETYVALKLMIDNWRWSGVPFYLRAGKGFPKRASEIAIVFQNAPGYLFQTNTRNKEPNILAIRIQPDEGISFKINCKIPGLNSSIQPVKMDFNMSPISDRSPRQRPMNGFSATAWPAITRCLHAPMKCWLPGSC